MDLVRNDGGGAKSSAFWAGCLHSFAGVTATHRGQRSSTESRAWPTCLRTHLRSSLDLGEHAASLALPLRRLRLPSPLALSRPRPADKGLCDSFAGSSTAEEFGEGGGGETIRRNRREEGKHREALPEVDLRNLLREAEMPASHRPLILLRLSRQPWNLGAARSALRCSANNRGVSHERKKTCNARRAARCRGSACGGCGLGVNVHCFDANEGVGR